MQITTDDALKYDDEKEIEKLTELAKNAKQGDMNSREELYRLLQDSFDRASNFYFHKCYQKIEKNEILHEIYLTTERAIGLYDEERGPFVFYLRALIKSNVNWLIIRLSRSTKETRYSLDDIDQTTNLKLADCIPDPSNLSYSEYSERFDLYKPTDTTGNNKQFINILLNMNFHVTKYVKNYI